MSVTTREAIATAIQNHVTDEWNDGELVIDWVITAATLDKDGDYAQGTIYSRDPAPGYIIRGLLTEAIAHLDYDTSEDDE